MSDQTLEVLSASDLLRETFNTLVVNLSGKMIKLPQKARALIGGDTDSDRSHSCFFGYEEIALVQIGHKCWALGRGLVCGSYTSDPFDSDITAVQLPGDVESEVEIAQNAWLLLKKGSYFRNCLLCAMSDGQLMFRAGQMLSGDVMGLKLPLINNYIVVELEGRADVFHLDFQPVAPTPVMYKKECSEYLAGVLERALS